MAFIDLPVGGTVEVTVDPVSEPGRLVYCGKALRQGQRSAVCTKHTSAFDSGQAVTFKLDRPIDSYTIKITASAYGSDDIVCTVTARAFDTSGQAHGEAETKEMEVRTHTAGSEVKFTVYMAA